MSWTIQELGGAVLRTDLDTGESFVLDPEEREWMPVKEAPKPTRIWALVEGVDRLARTLRWLELSGMNEIPQGRILARVHITGEATFDETESTLPMEVVSLIDQSDVITETGTIRWVAGDRRLAPPQGTVQILGIATVPAGLPRLLEVGPNPLSPRP